MIPSSAPVQISVAPLSPLVSVVIPALQVDRELRRCIDSLRLVCPNPDTCEILLLVPGAQFEAAIAMFPSERVLVESRRGVYAAMNDGVLASRGQYLYFLGKDDVVLPGMAMALQVLREAAPYVLFSDVYWGAAGVVRGKTSRLRILRANVCHQGIFYSRDAALSNGPFVRRLKTHADHLLNMRVLWNPVASGRVRYVPSPVAWYAATGLSSRTQDVVFHRLHPVLVGRYLGPVAGCLWRFYKLLRPDGRGRSGVPAERD